MPGIRYHAYAAAPVYSYAPPTSPSRLRRWWARLAASLFAEAQAAQVQDVFRAFAESAAIGPDFRVSAWAWCVNPGPKDRIQIGASVICRGLLFCEHFHPGTIVLGDNVYIGDNSIISCADQIEIGAFTMLAHGVQLFDNDAHPLDTEVRVRDQLIAVGRLDGERVKIAHAPIWIGERCWIGLNAIVLKGVRIGPGSVVAAGSVVTADVPPNTMAAGNPARVVRNLAETEAPSTVSQIEPDSHQT